jgi:hypothetical protein
VTNGEATSATTNIASVRSLIANLLMRLSCQRREDREKPGLREDQ